MEQAGLTQRARIRELQASLGRGARGGAGVVRREREVRELDALVAGGCVLCGDGAIRRVDEGFVAEGEEGGEEWAL